ncbi:unnamed protein product [Cylindrotheca closterium]|uniref:Multidrug and toxin extrusion protein n=1 Tax=Cylindrotheca closterium TaxID=2856 RepID=A0AAD2CU59_9STRA|nr:unnamed protein product [Cylindrotheca closterium]
MTIFAAPEGEQKEVLWYDKSERECLSKLEAAETSKDEGEEFDLWQESKSLLGIALPAVAVQFSVLFIFPQTASMVGRNLGKEQLAGFSLGSLVGNLTCLSVMVGALTAADTLMPRSFAAENYAEMGRLAVRGMILCSLLLIPPVIPLCTMMEWVFDKLGQDPEASHLATQWIRIYLIGVPAMLLFRVVQSFLNAQHQVWPMVYSSLAACFLVHPFLLKILVSRLEFIGSSLAICMTQYVMIAFLFAYMWFNPVHQKESWPGMSKTFFLESISPRPMLAFLSLSMGGVLSLSEWWFWETVCFIVGSFGVVPLCVHTIAYQLVPLLFMIPLGIMIGLTVRLGHLIAYDVPKAKKLAAWCMGFTTLLGLVVSTLLYKFRIGIAMLFSTDEEVIQGCKEIWPKLCYYIFVLYIFGINSAIMRALGMQWQMAAIIFGCLWVGTLPALAYFSIHQGGGIDAVWSTLPVFYTGMQFLLAYSYIREDWYEISKEIRRHALESVEEANGKLVNEETKLLTQESR